MAATMSQAEMTEMLNDTVARIERTQQTLKAAPESMARILRRQIASDRKSVQLLRRGLIWG